MCVLTNLGRLHCTHQDIRVEKWQCLLSDSCVCVRGLMGPSLTAAILWREREGWRDGGSNRGRSSVAPSSSQVNIDTAWADTVPAALINHFHWTQTNTHTHTHVARKTTHPVRHTTRAKHKHTLRSRENNGQFGVKKQNEQKNSFFMYVRYTHYISRVAIATCDTSAIVICCNVQLQQAIGIQYISNSLKYSTVYINFL